MSTVITVPVTFLETVAEQMRDGGDVFPSRPAGANTLTCALLALFFGRALANR